MPTLAALNLTVFQTTALLTMGPFDLLNHLLNFLAPAAWVAVIVALTLQAQAAINFVVCLITLLLGLLLFGRDGKMATYAAVVILGATSQWVMLRAWR